MTDLIDRLGTKFVAGDGCWDWLAATNDKGYGLIWNEGGMRRAHRVMYELMVGAIPDGLELDHLCLNHACVRPSHLEPVTGKENLRRRDALRVVRTVCRFGHSLHDAYRDRRSPGARKCRTCALARKKAA